MADIHDCIRSLLPGRLRLRHPMLHKMTANEAASLRELLLGIDGMTEVVINPTVGSALLLWDHNVLTQEALLETLTFYAEAFLEVGEAEPALLAVDKVCASCDKEILGSLEKGLSTVESAVVRTFAGAARTLTPNMAAKNGRRAARILQNRTMLGLFTGSIAALAVKQTGWHVGLGAVFMALLAIHLQQHRRVL